MTDNHKQREGKIQRERARESEIDARNDPQRNFVSDTPRQQGVSTNLSTNNIKQQYLCF